MLFSSQPVLVLYVIELVKFLLAGCLLDVIVLSCDCANVNDVIFTAIN